MPYADPEKRKVYERERRAANRDMANEYARSRRALLKASDPDGVSQRERERYLRRRDQILAQKKKRYDANPRRYRAEAREWALAHPEIAKAKSHEHYVRNRERYATIARLRRLQSYGLEVSDYQAMLERQAHRCALCRDPFSADRTPHIDHDHDSGAVRGLLCGPCNRGIGLLREDPRLFARAAAYLEGQSFATP